MRQGRDLPAVGCRAAKVETRSWIPWLARGGRVFSTACLPLAFLNRMVAKSKYCLVLNEASSDHARRRSYRSYIHMLLICMALHVEMSHLKTALEQRAKSFNIALGTARFRKPYPKINSPFGCRAESTSPLSCYPTNPSDQKIRQSVLATFNQMIAKSNCSWCRFGSGSIVTGVPKYASTSSITSDSVVLSDSATCGDTRNITSLFPIDCFDIALACSRISKHMV